MDIVGTIVTLAGPVVAAGIVWLLSKGLSALFDWLKKKNILEEGQRTVFLSIAAIAERSLDKFVREVQEAKEETSDGGAQITAAEWSKIRQDAYDIVMAELKGPALQIAKDLGEATIKGLISRYIRKAVNENNTIPDPVPAAQPAAPSQE